MIYVLIYSVIGLLAILYYSGLIERDNFLNDTSLEDIVSKIKKESDETI